MKWVHIQNALSVPGNPTASVTLTNVTAGDMIVLQASVSDQSGTPLTVSDTSSNSYTTIGSGFALVGGGGSGTLWLLSTIANASVSSLTITVVSHGNVQGSGNASIVADEYSAGPNCNITVIGGPAFNSGGGGNATCGTITRTPGILALDYGALMILNFQATSASSPTYTVNCFHDAVFQTPGVSTFHILNDISSSATPGVTIGSTSWCVGGVIFGAIATTDQLYIDGPSTAVVSILSNEFTAFIGATSGSSVTVTPTSSVPGDQFTDTSGNPITTLAIPSGSLLANFRMILSSSGPRTISVSAPGYTTPNGPITVNGIAFSIGSINITQPIYIENTTGPIFNTWGNQATAAIRWQFHANSLAGSTAGQIPVIDFGNNSPGVPLFQFDPGAQQATVTAVSTTNNQFITTFPLMYGQTYDIALLWSSAAVELWIDGLLYSTSSITSQPIFAYRGIEFGCGVGAAVNYGLSNLSMWSGYNPTPTELAGMSAGTLLPIQTATSAAAWWTFGGTNGGTPAITDAGFDDLSGNGNGWSVASGSIGTTTYGPALTTGSPVLYTAIVSKWGGNLVIGACGNARGTGAGYPITSVANVSSVPVIKRNGTTVQTQILWTSETIDSSFITLLLQCGGVGFVAMETVGSNYTSPTASWTGGGGTGLTLGTPRLATGITSYQINNPGSGFAEPPSISISDSTGSGAVAHAIMGMNTNVGTWSVYSVVIDNGGSNYTSPTATVVGGGGNGATLSVQVSDGVITGITVTFPGQNYNAMPAISVAPPLNNSQGINSTPVLYPTTLVWDSTSGNAGKLRTIFPNIASLGGCGNGYTSATLPTISFGMGNGFGFHALFTVTGGVITSVTTLGGPWNGQDYPDGTYPLNIDDPTGSGAAVTVLMQFGGFQGATISNGGSNYSNPHGTIAPSGSTVSIRPVLSTYISYIPVTSQGHSFTSPPTISISDSTGSGASARALMTGAASGDTFTWSAPQNWFNPRINNLSLGGIQAVTNAAVTNSVGSREPNVGGFECFSQTPTNAGGGDIGSQPSSPYESAFTAKNRYFQAGFWAISGGSLTTDQYGEPITWTSPFGSILSRWCYGPLDNSNSLDNFSLGGYIGQWTLSFTDPNVNTSSAMYLYLTANQTCTPYNTSGPHLDTYTPVVLNAADVTVSNGQIVGLSTSHTSFGTGWQSAIAIITDPSGQNAIATTQVSGGTVTGFTILGSGFNYSSTPTVSVYGTSVSSNIVKIIFNTTNDPSTATFWGTNIHLGAAGPTGPGGLGYWTVSDVWVVPPSNITGLALPIDYTNPLATDDNVVNQLTATNGKTLGVARFMDITEGFGGTSNYVWPWDLITSAGKGSWGYNRLLGVQATSARLYNTDPNNSTYAWSSPKVYGGQGEVFTNLDPTFTITGTLTAGSNIINNVSSNSLMIGSKITGTGIPSQDTSGNPVCIAFIPQTQAPTTLTLSYPATQSGTFTFTITNPPYITVDPNDYGLYTVQQPAGNNEYQLVVIEFTAAIPHGLSTGQQCNVFSPGSNPVAIPVTNASPFAARNLSGGYCWVTGPHSVVVACYIVNLINPDAPQTPFPQQVNSTTPVDLTANGNVGWEVYTYVPIDNQNVPYEYTGEFAAQHADCILWTNIPQTASDYLIKEIAHRVVAPLVGKPNSIALEYSNELWNGFNAMSGFSPFIARLWSYITTGTISGYIPATGQMVANLLRGVTVPWASYTYDIFKSVASSLGFTNPIYRLHGSWWAEYETTQEIVQVSNQFTIPFEGVCTAPYQNTPEDWPIIQAMSPVGSIIGSGSAAMLPSSIIDLFRYSMTYSNYNQNLWAGHFSWLQQSYQTSKPFHTTYEGGSTQPVAYGVPVPFQDVEGHDVMASPSYLDAVYDYYSSSQQGNQAIAGSGTFATNFFSLYNDHHYEQIWVICYGAFQVAGDGISARYDANGTYSGPLNQYALVGAPSDYHDHNGGPNANSSPGIQGLRLWFSAGVAPTTATLTAPSTGTVSVQVTCTVSLNQPAGSGGVVVDPAVTGLSVPPFTIAQGQTSGQFVFTPPTPTTYSISIATSPTLTYINSPTSFTATQTATSATLSVPTTGPINIQVTCTVTLDFGAPTGGIVVTPTVTGLSVPPFTIADGQTSGQFHFTPPTAGNYSVAITTSPVLTYINVPSSFLATQTATSATLSAPGSGPAGQLVTCGVTLDAVAPPGGIVVTPAVTNISGLTPFTIAAGTTTGSFHFTPTIPQDYTISITTSPVLTYIHSPAEYTATQTATSATLSAPASAPVNTLITATVTLDFQAPPGGVLVTPSVTGLSILPFTIAAGSLSGNFQFTPTTPGSYTIAIVTAPILTYIGSPAAFSATGSSAASYAVTGLNQIGIEVPTQAITITPSAIIPADTISISINNSNCIFSPVSITLDNTAMAQVIQVTGLLAGSSLFTFHSSSGYAFSVNPWVVDVIGAVAVTSWGTPVTMGIGGPFMVTAGLGGGPTGPIAAQSTGWSEFFDATLDYIAGSGVVDRRSAQWTVKPESDIKWPSLPGPYLLMIPETFPSAENDGMGRFGKLFNVRITIFIIVENILDQAWSDTIAVTSRSVSSGPYKLTHEIINIFEQAFITTGNGRYVTVEPPECANIGKLARYAQANNYMAIPLTFRMLVVENLPSTDVLSATPTYPY